MRFLRAALCLTLSTAALGQEPAPAPPKDPSITLSEDQIRDLIRQSADNDLENDKKQRDYTYVEREEVRRLDGKGQVKSTEVKTYDVMEIYGEQVQKLIAKRRPASLRQRRKERRRENPEAHRQAQERIG